MALQASDIIDLVATTQDDLGKMKFTEIATDLQEHVALPNLIRRNRVSFRSGENISYNVMVTESGAAQRVGLFQVDNVDVGDVMQTATVPWRHVTTNYAFDRREISMNRSPAKIVDLVKVRRADAMISLAELMETDFWSKPATSSDTERTFGVQYWIVRSATSNGFNGGNPSGFTSGAAGIDSDTYTRWANWTERYVNITKTDLVAKWRRAATKTHFKSPVPIPSYNTGDRYGYYCNYDVLGTLEELLEAQNDQLGNDIASKDGRTLFRGTPVTYVPKLDDESTDPVYGINWGVFKPVFLTGEYMREDPPKQAPNQHNVFRVHIDLTLNFVCHNRRRLFICDKA